MTAAGNTARSHSTGSRTASGSKFAPTATALYRFSTCGDTATTVEDTVMAIYRSNSGSCGSLTEVACSDDACGLRSTITNTLIGGKTYFIVVWRFALGGPGRGLRCSCASPG